MKWKMPILVVDVETTGFKPPKNTVVSIGAVLMEKGKIVDEFYSTVWPGEEYFENGIADEALAVNKLTIEELRSAPSTESVAKEFGAWLNGRAKKVTAFNVAFDSSFLKREPWGLVPPNIAWGNCVMLSACDRMGKKGALPTSPYGGYKWPRLEEAVRFFKIGVSGELHNALEDARAAANIMLAMMGKKKS